jgi:chemotaxis protein MotB
MAKPDRQPPLQQPHKHMAEVKTAPIIIRKKIIHGGKHGGAWKVAYADFVTAMMALFIVLWLMNSKQEVKQAVGGYFRDPAGKGKLVGTNRSGTGRDLNIHKDDMSELKERLKSVIKLIPHFEQLKGNVELTITEEGLRIELFETANGLFFQSGKPEPSPVGKELLTVLAGEIGKLPNRVLIEGHTDSTPYSGEDYSNWELSSDRANQARHLMTQHGLAPSQVAQVRGYADQDLHNKTSPEDPANRRVSVIVKYQDSQDSLKLPAAQAVGTVVPTRPVEQK